MQMTENGIALIKRFEGFRGTAYRCPAGVWTIGYGHTSTAGPPAVARGMVMTDAMADTVLRADVGVFAKAVADAVQRDISDAQFSALVSFAYNVGLGGFRSSSVLKAVRDGDFDAVPRRLQLWVKGGGKVLPGLVRRRAAEAELFAGGEGGASRADTGIPEPKLGKPATHSTTVTAGLLSALAAVASAGLGFNAGQGAAVVIVGIIGLAAAVWIIRERMLKSKQEGL